MTHQPTLGQRIVAAYWWLILSLGVLLSILLVAGLVGAIVYGAYRWLVAS